MYYTTYLSPIGELYILSDGNRITGIHFDYELTVEEQGDHLPVLIAASQWLKCYFDGRNPDPHALPLQPDGTHFQRLVWSLLSKIPYGKSISYGSLAAKAAAALSKSSMSAQAIGGAVGRNPIVIVIPCHRVLGAKGQLTGFSCGKDRKRFLLDLEQIPYTE